MKMQVWVFAATWLIEQVDGFGRTTKVCEGPLPYSKDMAFDTALSAAREAKTVAEVRLLMAPWIPSL